MLITEPPYYLFVAIIFSIYWFLSGKNQNFLLLFASYIFYISVSWVFSVLLLFLSFATFYVGELLKKHSKKEWLYLGIGVNLGIWLLFKANDFFTLPAHEFLLQLGFNGDRQGLKILLPIGLSFYILQSISYLVDVSRQQVKEDITLSDFCLYLAYFPKLTAGPIERPNGFFKQLNSKRYLNRQECAEGTMLLVIGLFRKLVIADTLFGAIPPELYTDLGDLAGFQLYFWTMTLVFAIYNDFCGYTNIVRGISLFFGISLSRNFRYPFLARSLSEFWNRWHISLSMWLRDYIYLPVGRSIARKTYKCSNVAILNVMVPSVLTMFCSGIWHAQDKRFLLWGLVMGVWIGIEGYVRTLNIRTRLNKNVLWRECLSRLLLFGPGLLILSIPLGRELPLFDFFIRFFTHSDSLIPDTRVFLLFIPSLAIDFIQFFSKSEFIFLYLNYRIQSVLIATFTIIIFLFSVGSIPEPFVYQGF